MRLRFLRPIRTTRRPHPAPHLARPRAPRPNPTWLVALAAGALAALTPTWLHALERAEGQPAWTRFALGPVPTPWIATLDVAPAEER